MFRRQKSAFTLVELLVVIAIISVLVAMTFPAVQTMRETARRSECLNRIHQVGLATAMFHELNDAFPPARLYPKKFAVPPFDKGFDQPSWLIRILPYLEQQNFYQHWDLSASYSAHPQAVTSQAIETFLCPSRHSIENAHAAAATQSVTTTLPCGCGSTMQIAMPGGATGDFAGNHGDPSPGSSGAETDYYYGGNGNGILISSQARKQTNGRLEWIDRIKYSSVSDGTSNTVLAGELHVSLNKLNTSPFNGPVYNGAHVASFTRLGGPGVPILSSSEEPESSILGFGSWHPGVCNFEFVDGSTRSLSNDVDTVTLGQLCNRADQPIVDFD
jgi:prepilin-type N-terminal cleavage/methylation domain-containing protein